MNRVVVTGLGCITPIGNTVADFQTSLFAGTTGIAPFPHYPEAPGDTQGFRFTQSAAVKNFDPRRHLESGIVAASDRTTQFAIVAARQAALESQPTNHHSPEKIAIIVGCACGGRQAEETETIQASIPRTPGSIPSPSFAPWPLPGPATSPSNTRSPARPQHLDRLLLRHSRHRPRLPDGPQRNGRRRDHRRP